MTFGIALINSDMKMLELNCQMRRWFPQVCAEKNPVCYRVLHDPPLDVPCKNCPVAGAFQEGSVFKIYLPRTHALPTANDKLHAIFLLGLHGCLVPPSFFWY